MLYNAGTEVPNLEGFCLILLSSQQVSHSSVSQRHPRINQSSLLLPEWKRQTTVTEENYTSSEKHEYQHLYHIHIRNSGQTEVMVRYLTQHNLPLSANSNSTGQKIPVIIHRW